MLKYIRVVLAVLSILALTFMFLDFTGLAARWLDWLPKMQLIPALLAVNFLAVAFLAVITYLFGRIYCSVICPLGIFQDFVIRVRSLFASKRKKKVGLFRYTPANSRLRYGFLIGFCILLALGLTGIIATSIAGILDPYSAYGRMVGQFVVPGWRAGVEAAADKAAEGGHYLIAGVPAVAPWSLAVTIVAAVTLLVVVAFSATK
ncbi:MAG: 4Fe-4S binding protein, partial [Muribaculaceae bacterium]|nr:4Fe-4S binding protein [Muribaculaceae bacterium]